MISTLALYNHLERNKAKGAAVKEEKEKLETQLAKRIPLRRRDGQDRRFGIRGGVKRLEIEKNAISFPDLLAQVLEQLVPKTRHKQVEQLRRKLARPYKYSTYHRASEP